MACGVLLRKLHSRDFLNVGTQLVFGKFNFPVLLDTAHPLNIGIYSLDTYSSTPRHLES
jgi:hypothetical protein